MMLNENEASGPTGQQFMLQKMFCQRGLLKSVSVHHNEAIVLGTVYTI